MVNPLKVRNLRLGLFEDCKNDRIDAAASAMVVDRMREKSREPGGHGAPQYWQDTYSPSQRGSPR
jgi:hypothetical protein